MSRPSEAVGAQPPKDETTSMVPSMLAFNSSRSSAGIQYSRMVSPPTWWTS